MTAATLSADFRQRFVANTVEAVRDGYVELPDGTLQPWNAPDALHALECLGFNADEAALIDALEWQAAAEAYSDRDYDDGAPIDFYGSRAEWNTQRLWDAELQFAGCVARLATPAVISALSTDAIRVVA